MVEAEETPDTVDPLDRPLPSVDMRLLRDERRSLRMKQALLGAGALLLVSGGTVAAVVVSGGEPDEENTGDDMSTGTVPFFDGEEHPEVTESDVEPDADDDPGDGSAAPEPVAEPGRPTVPGAVSRITREFGQARGFRDALTRAGVESEEYSELERALTDVMDFRRCRPEDRMVFERDTDGNLVLFEYRGGSATEYYRARRSGVGGLVGEKVEIPVETIRVARGGVIRTSLGAAVVDLGFQRSLVGTLVSVFERKANFGTDARTGDTFRLIVEEERINGRFHRYGNVLAMQYNGQRTGELFAFWYQPSSRQPGDYYDETGRSMHGGWLRTPLRYDRISSHFNPNRMHPILRRVVPHNGTDYAAGTGTPVWAAADGTVTFAGVRGANGNLVTIRHADGYDSSYAHLHRIERGIRNGVEVEQRQLIGYVGSTGRSTGPHLHFGLKHNGRFIDPLDIINGPGRMMAAGHLGAYRTHVRRMSRQLGEIDAGAPDPEHREQASEPAEDEPLD